MPSYALLRTLSYVHSALYAALLGVWLAPGLEGPTFVFGLGHGVGWIVMSLLAIAGERRRTISLSMAVLISVVGAVGPFAGSFAFAFQSRRARPATA